MKIDEACINHNAVRIITELAKASYALIADGSEDYKADEERGYVLMTLGEIRGVLDLAEGLKAVLKS